MRQAFYHPLIAGYIRQHILHRINRALDVACGTGLSTQIVLEFADEVIGCDSSQAMLDEHSAIRASSTHVQRRPTGRTQMSMSILFAWVAEYDGGPDELVMVKAVITEIAT